MMNFESVANQLKEKGYHRYVTTRTSDEGLNIIDYKHRRKMDMYSVYVNSLGSVTLVEYTKIKWSNEAKRNVPVVTKIYKLNHLLQILG